MWTLLGNVIHAIRVGGYFVYIPFIHHVCLSECKLALKDSTLQRDCVLYRILLAYAQPGSQLLSLTPIWIVYLGIDKERRTVDSSIDVCSHLMRN